MSKSSLADLLNESQREAEKRLADKKQVEGITALAKAKLTHVRASDGDLVCPSCGYKGSEPDFEPDTDEESDGYSTDDVTSSSGAGDPDNTGDAAKALKAKYANRHLTVVDRILLNRGIDPFED